MTTRTTHAHDGDVVVFLIGMTFTRPWRVDKWLPVFAAMPRMLAELERARVAAEGGEGEDPGFLGARTTIGRTGPTVIQYWRSTEDLYRYAADPSAEHLPAWRRFNQTARRGGGAVGIWHETYSVPADRIETMYVDATVGLGEVAGTVPVARRGERARQRLGGRLHPAA